MSTTNILALFHPVVAEWFRQQYGEPSPPQVRGWPVIAAGEHTLIFSPTGSGKTLAAFLWCIDDIFRLGLNQPEKTFQKNSGGVHTLYVSPLKALNNDIQRNLQLPIRGISRQAEEAGIKMPLIRTIARTGDTPGTIRRSMVQTPPHILITTPESLYLLLTSPRGREIFRQVRFLIIDEIHALSNNKRGVHLSLSLERMVSLNQTEPLHFNPEP
jgi:ATP-dependent Lhr-like helicase